jgi:hypothetical protein
MREEYGLDNLQSCNGEGDDYRAILSDLLRSAIRISTADMGNIQLLDSDNHLRIEVHYGLPPSFLEFFDQTHKDQAACASALGKHGQHYDDDSMQVMLDAGIHAVQSIPLKTSGGRVAGMMSMLYRQPRLPKEQDRKALDALAELATAMMEDDWLLSHDKRAGAALE